MKDIKMVIDYSGLDYFKVLELPVDTFALMRKNYVIDLLQQSEKGREYIEQCERIKVTEPDIDGLRKIRK